MAQDDQAFDPINRGEPARHAGIGFVVDGAVGRKGSNGGGVYAAEIKRCHGVFL